MQFLIFVLIENDALFALLCIVKLGGCTTDLSFFLRWEKNSEKWER